MESLSCRLTKHILRMSVRTSGRASVRPSVRPAVRRLRPSVRPAVRPSGRAAVRLVRPARGTYENLAGILSTRGMYIVGHAWFLGQSSQSH